MLKFNFTNLTVTCGKFSLNKHNLFEFFKQILYISIHVLSKLRINFKLFLHFLKLILDGKFESELTDNAYKVTMRLTITSVSPSDFGSYSCVAKNSLGETDGTIKLYS